MKKYLITEIAPITPELLERFKASGEWIVAYYPTHVAKIRYYSEDDSWECDDERGYYEPTHYLPDGLPDPSAAVEVFEAVVFREVDSKLVQLPGSFDEDDRVIIMRTPAPND
jgi:hypothetical protein